jgi:iron complex outermembrane receptor protein
MQPATAERWEGVSQKRELLESGNLAVCFHNNHILRWAEKELKMKTVKILGLIGFLAIAIFAQNTGTITGRVVQNSPTISQDTVRNKTVTLQAKTGDKIIETKTDNDGNFVFENVPGGDYRITVDCGYCRRDEVGREITVSAGQTLTLDIELPKIGISETVTVSADTEQTIEQVSKTVDVITGQEMRDRADFSLGESLRTIPGFRVQQLGGFGRTATIKTRGLRNQDTALLIDGIRFRDASAITGDASPFLSDFTLTSVSRVEVLRGSGSSLYGTNAIGGVVDFQTPKPQAGWHGQISGAFGGLGLARFRGNTSYGTENGRYGFNLGLSRTNYFEGIDSNDDAKNTNFQTRIELNPFKRLTVSLRGFVSDAFVKLNTSPNMIGPGPGNIHTIVDAEPLSISELERYAAGTPIGSLNRGNANFIPDTDDPDNFQRSKFYSGQGVATFVLNDKLFFQGYFQALFTKRKNVNGPGGVPFQPFGGDETSIYKGTIQTQNFHFNWRPNKINEIVAGVETEWEKFGNDGTGPGGSPNFTLDTEQTSRTFYAQDLLRFFGGRLQIAGGFRAQFFGVENPVMSGANPPYQNIQLDDPPTAYTFDGSFSYLFKTGTKIRAHAGNGYRVPSLFERLGAFYDSFSTPNRFVPIGDPRLKPERTTAFDGGVEQTFASNRARLSATYFYTTLTDIIGYGALPQPDPFGRDNNISGGGYLNLKGGISRGLELSGRFAPTVSTDLFASYTYTNSDQLVPQLPGSGVSRTFGVPTSQFTLVATQRFDRLWVNVDFVATSDYLTSIFSTTTFDTFIYRFAGNRRADVTAGYTFPVRGEKVNLRLFGTLENVFGYDYFENGFRTTGRTGRVGLSFGF